MRLSQAARNLLGRVKGGGEELFVPLMKMVKSAGNNSMFKHKRYFNMVKYVIQERWQSGLMLSF